MAGVLFISEDFLTDNSVINSNTEFKQLRPTILAAQEMQIQQAIGSPMMEELEDQITNSTLTSANRTLLVDYIQMALLYWVMSEAPLVLSYKYANKGIVKHDSDNASPATLNEINFLAQRYKSKAEWFTERITDFLCANVLDYPTYAGSVPDGGINPRQNEYTSGLFVGTQRAQGRLDNTRGFDVFKEPYDCDC